MGEAVHTLSIIIPAYNEEKTIAELLQRVLDADLGTGIERELIVVNDCSTDSTEQIVEDFIAHHADAPIVYLKHERNYGKGMAVRTGIRAVTGDYIVMQDADLELDPNDFKKMLPFLLSGEYHVVYGLSLIHISEPTRQAEISYAVFCLKKKKKKQTKTASDKNTKK